MEKSHGVEVSAPQSPETKMIALGEVFLDLRRGNGTLAIGASAAFKRPKKNRPCAMGCSPLPY